MSLARLPWALWRSQVLAVLRLEAKKSFLARRGFWIYLLALAPVLLFAAHSFIATHSVGNERFRDIGENSHIFAGIFQLFFLRLSIFFGCVGIFMNLFRAEMMEKSLHYYFLAAMKREVLLVGKFLSGLLAATVIFGTSTLLQFIACYWQFDSSTIHEYLYHGNGLGHLTSYLGVTLLACVGYGSVFLAAGVLFRNPLIPTVLVLAWEAISGFLPRFLQQISVIFYLKSLCPVQVPAAFGAGRDNPLALIAMNPSPASIPTAILGLSILSIVLLALSGIRVRRMQIDYAGD